VNTLTVCERQSHRDSVRGMLETFAQVGRCCLLALAFMTVSACGDTHFTVEHAPQWRSAGHHIAVFGVERDGLLSRDGWRVLGPEQRAPFDAQRCNLMFSQATFETTPELANAIDAYVRSNGATDTLLDQLAPASTGDTILVLSMSGRPIVSSASGSSGQSMPALSGSRGGGGRRGGRGGGMRQETAHSSPEGDGVHASAVLFSISEHRSVARIDMLYTGSSSTEALLAFTRELDQQLPQAHCSCKRA
jgi:hypothetical protein